MNRREFLQFSGLSGVALGAGLVPFQTFAAAQSNLNYVFVFNGGGWDPTRVFANCFDQRSVDMELDSGVSSIGELSWVDHIDRPSVTTFFQRYHQSSVIFNGLLVPSVAHGNCQRLMMTGTSNDGASDWAAIIAGQSSMDLALPQMVLSGPSFPGQHGTAVTRAGTGGQLDALLSGDVLNWSDQLTDRPPARAEDRMDSYLVRRAAAAVESANMPRAKELYAAYEASLVRGVELKDLQDVINWSAGGSLTAQGNLAGQLLTMGISRTVMMNHGGSGWDSHTNNDQTQSQSWESLFGGLLDMADRFASLPGRNGGNLLEETVIVVMSEMGRTPALNNNEGKDHWPYTSALVMGPGFTGGRVIGATDEFYYGERIDYDSGELHRNGQDLTVGNLGATLLAAADVDSYDYLPGMAPIAGVLA
jgi:hypothetical protein